MRATFALTGLMPLLLLATPASAATAAQKMETCKYGADHDSLAGAKRDAFIKKCMTNANYEPAARKEALKKKPVSAKKPAAAAPAATEEEPDEKPQ
jgi:hypothetical protein